jgi:hypothetical protein
MLAEPPTPARAAPDQPVWEPRQVREHINFLSSSSLAQRSIGTTALDQAAEYVAARMRGYRLQPALERYRVPYRAHTHQITSAELAVVGEDSVRLQIGYDFWADGRSDAGSISLRNVHLSPRRVIDPMREGTPDVGIFVDGSWATRDQLDSLSAVGFDVAFVIRSLAPVADVKPIDGMLVMQITDATAAWLLGLTRDGFRQLWEDETPSVRSVARRIEARVEAEGAMSVEAVNVIGYLAGRVPRLMGDVVVIAAAIDGPGTTAGERVTDYRQIGTAASAMLELARHEQDVSRRFMHPMRSVMFAGLTGTRSGHQGLRALFGEKPIWDLNRVVSVIYLGLPEDQEPFVRQFLEARGIDLVVVRPDQPQPFERRYVFASERSARSRSPVPWSDPPPTSPETSAVNAAALEAAMEMVRKAHAVLQEKAGMLPPQGSIEPLVTQDTR